MANFVETHEALKAAREVEQAEQASHQEEQIAVDEFLQRNANAVKEWVKSHPGERPPVYYDRKTKRVFWLNRRQRKQMMMEEAKKRKREERASLRRSINQDLTAKNSNSETTENQGAQNDGRTGETQNNQRGESFEQDTSIETSTTTEIPEGAPARDSEKDFNNSAGQPNIDGAT